MPGPYEQAGHWVNSLGLPRLNIPPKRVVFSPTLDAVISEICDLGGLGDLEEMLHFSANDIEPPVVAGRESEIVALRDRLKREHEEAAKEIRRAFGLDK